MNLWRCLNLWEKEARTGNLGASNRAPNIMTFMLFNEHGESDARRSYQIFKRYRSKNKPAPGVSLTLKIN